MIFHSREIFGRRHMLVAKDQCDHLSMGWNCWRSIYTQMGSNGLLCCGYVVESKYIFSTNIYLNDIWLNKSSSFCIRSDLKRKCQPHFMLFLIKGHVVINDADNIKTNHRKWYLPRNFIIRNKVLELRFGWIKARRFLEQKILWDLWIDGCPSAEYRGLESQITI